MNPKQFLQIVGIILILLAVVGFLAPDIGDSFLSFDAAENWAHLVLGIVAVIAAPMPIGDLKKWIVVLIGLIGIIVGAMGFLASGNPPPNFYGVTNFENPADNVLHVVVGIWALFAAFNKKI